MYIAIGIFSVAFAILAWRRLDLALLLIVAGLPSYLIRFSIGGIPLTWLEVMILIAAAAWIIKDFLPANRDFFRQGFRRQPGRINYPYGWEIIALLIVSLIAVGIAGFSAGALGIWKAYFFEPALLFILILNTFKDRHGVIKILTALTISTAVVSIFAIYQQITGQYIANPFWAAEETRRVVSFFGYPNAVGLYLAPLSLILFGWLFSLGKKSFWLKGGLAATIVFSWLAIFFARSEGALVAIAGGLFIFSLFAARWSRWAAIGLATIAIAGVFWFRPLTDPIIEKAALRDLSGEIRRQQWLETTTMLKDGRLVSGAGLDNYQNAIRPYHQDGIFFNFDNRPNFDAVVWASSTLQAIYWQPVEIYLYPHNILFNFWSELGLAGLLLFIWLFAKALHISYRNFRKADDRYISLGLLTALTAIIIHGLVDVPYFKNDLAPMFWLILAIEAIIYLNNKLGQAQPLTQKQ